MRILYIPLLETNRWINLYTSIGPNHLGRAMVLSEEQIDFKPAIQDRAESGGECSYKINLFTRRPAGRRRRGAGNFWLRPGV
jgi:hypothetical protein